MFLFLLLYFSSPLESEKHRNLEQRMTTKSTKEDPKSLLKKLQKLQSKLLEDLRDVCHLTEEIQALYPERREPLKTLYYN